jgi:hypothetical protein
MIAMLALVIVIFPVLGGCEEEEKQQGKDAVREFVEEEKQKERERTKDLWRNYGKSGHMPTDPFANMPDYKGPKKEAPQPQPAPKQ